MTGSRRTRAPLPREAGFTLIELLLVLGILALAGSFAVPFVVRPSGDAALEATARRLAGQMLLARASAIRSNAPRTVTIDLARRRFRADGVAAETPVAQGVSIDVLTLQRETRSGGIARMRFFPDGSSTGGRVLFSTRRRSVAVDLDWMTGHAYVSRRP